MSKVNRLEEKSWERVGLSLTHAVLAVNRRVILEPTNIFNTSMG